MTPAPHRLHGATTGGVAESRGELVGDAGRAEALERIVRDDGMDDRAVRELLAGQVVVGDDDLDAGRAGRCDLLHRTDSAVDGDHELGVTALQLLHARHRQPVAVREPVWDEPVALGSERPERRDQDRRRGDAVHVVVAVDRYVAAFATTARICSQTSSMPVNSVGSWDSRASRKRRAASTVRYPRPTSVTATGSASSNSAARRRTSE